MMEEKLLVVILVAVFGKLLAVSVCPMRNDPKPPMREKAANQLNEFMKHKKRIDTLKTDYGAPIGDQNTLLTVGPRGPALLQDIVFVEEMAHFDRERIPERRVHAKGAAAFGTFKVTNDITTYTGAKLFSKVGKETPIALRLSVGGNRHGAPDSVRDIRGFALKFYTEDGNWDIVGLNHPVFFVRNPTSFISVAHVLKNPVTDLNDADMFWDFMSLMPESTNMLVHFFSDRGIPYSYRFMNGYGINTFKLVNDNKEAVYCKFHFKTKQGIKNLSDEQATKLAGKDPDSSTRDLYNAIANGDYPSWTMYIQVMTFDQAKTFRFNPFDPTKFWPEDEYPLMEVGVLTLNKNPINYFAQVEQLAFSPSSLVWGIEPSPDRVLQGRLFSYPDTQRYRLGANYLQIPVNKAVNLTVRNYERDGAETVTDNQGGAPNYYPNSFCGPTSKPTYKPPAFSTSGDVVDRWDSDDEDNFTQAGIFYREVLGDGEKTRLAQNIANGLMNAQVFIQQRAVKNFKQADSDLGEKIQQELETLQGMEI